MDSVTASEIIGVLHSTFPNQCDYIGEETLQYIAQKTADGQGRVFATTEGGAHFDLSATLDILDKAADLIKVIIEIGLALRASGSTSHTAAQFRDHVNNSPKVAHLASKHPFIQGKFGAIIDNVYSTLFPP